MNVIKKINRYFCKIEYFAYGEINKRSFSNPHPRTKPEQNTRKAWTMSIFHVQQLFSIFYFPFSSYTFRKFVPTSAALPAILVDFKSRIACIALFGVTTFALNTVPYLTSFACNTDGQTVLKMGQWIVCNRKLGSWSYLSRLPWILRGRPPSKINGAPGILQVNLTGTDPYKHATMDRSEMG